MTLAPDPTGPPTTPPPELVWPAAVVPGTATGVGSLPGEDPARAQREVLELLPALPYLVELPARGPGADMIGRGAALLVDLPVDLQPAGWRLVDRPGREVRRAHDLMSRDLDALAEAADGWAGLIKLQVVGPWTLAAELELPRGDKALSDRGAVVDLAESLADGVAAHVKRVAALVPGAQLVVQVDEPALPAVRLGHVRTASGFSVLRTPEAPELRDLLARVLAAAPRCGVHCCARDVPVGLLRDAGASWVSLDLTLLDPVREDDALGEALEAGIGLVLGVDGAARDPSAPVAELARRLALPADLWLPSVVLAPRCGLAGFSPAAAWAQQRAVVAAARRIADAVSGG